ncbi:MAG TPA: DUF4337 domain-containing protein [Fimbriiglobus sp.]|nr:DUF4337 domain-containing protein [Fimbriiglobus sp.]
MPEVELPDPDEAHEKAGHPFTRAVALCVAVYAVALAVSSLGGSNAAKDMMMSQQRAANQWAYYQAKAVRENLYLLEAEKFDLELEVRGAAMSETDRRRVEQLRDKYRKKAAGYGKEKEEIMAEARKEEAARDVAQRRDPYFDAAEVCLQVGIVLASVAMLSGKRWAFAVSLVLAVAGAALAANGFGLFVAVPGLE